MTENEDLFLCLMKWTQNYSVCVCVCVRMLLILTTCEQTDVEQYLQIQLRLLL